jgi:hypothetical protein
MIGLRIMVEACGDETRILTNGFVKNPSLFPFHFSRAGTTVTACIPFLNAQPLKTQDSTVDVVRGRIVDDSSRALRGAAITIIRGPDRLVQQTTTDSAGNYRVRFVESRAGDFRALLLIGQ